MTAADLQEKMGAYLLGELSDPEQAALEDLYFTDEAAHQELLATEDELIDSYARGELRGKSRKQFERLFLGSARRREKLEIARVLISVVDLAALDVEPWRETSPRSTLRLGWRFALLPGAAALALAIGLSVFQQHAVDSTRSESDGAREAVRTGPAPGQRPSEKLEAPPRERTGVGEWSDSVAPDAPGEQLTLRLRPMLRGEGESNQRVVRSSAPIVRLEADLEGRLYQVYEAVLQDAAGSNIRRQSGLSRRGRTVTWQLDTRDLPPGAYAVVFFGRDARGLHLAGHYSLSIR